MKRLNYIKIRNTIPVVLFLTLILSVMFISCENGEPCNGAETRCNDNTVEVCNTDNEWHSLLNCDDINSVCCYLDDSKTHTCLERCE